MSIQENMYLAQYKYAKYLVLNVMKDEIINYQVEMINNNIESGLIMIDIKQFNSNIELNYNVKDLESLEEYLSKNKTDLNDFIKIIKNIYNILEKYDEFFLNKYNYLLDIDRVYINPLNKVITMIYIPIVNDVNNNINFNFKELVRDIVILCMDKYWGNNDRIATVIIENLEREDFDIVSFNEFLVKLAIKNSEIQYDPNVGHGYVEEKRKLVNERDVKNNCENGKQVRGGIVSGFMKAFKKNDENKNKSVNIKNMKTSELNEIINKSKKEIVSKGTYDTEILTIGNKQYLIFNNETTIERIEINKDNFFVGRLKEQVDLFIPNQTIGKVHCKIVKDKENIYLADLNSKNGTYINNVKLEPNEFYKLSDEDEVRFAKVTFKYKEI